MESQILESFFIPEPEDYPTATGKLMILMHGLGDSLESYKILAKEINVTGMSYLLLNAPDSYYMGYSWYDIPPGNPELGIQRSIGLIHQVLNECEQRGYASEDIFLAGFSQGGCMALNAAIAWKKKLAGVVALSPKMTLVPELNGEDPFFQNPIFMAHGEHDQVIPFNETVDGRDKLKSLGATIDWHTYSMGHEIDIDEIFELRDWLNQYL